MPTREDLIARKQARIDEVHRLDPRRTALLVIDMQRGFMDPEASMLVSQAWDIVAPIKKMIDFCRGTRIPVIFTEFVAAPAVPSLREDPFGPEHLLPPPGESRRAGGSHLATASWGPRALNPRRPSTS